MVLVLYHQCRGAEPDAPRYYLQLRYSESLPFTRAHDGFGASIGANLSRHLSAELSLDRYDIHLSLPGVGKVAELGNAVLMPQLRLRYPMLQDRLEPYLVGGIGVALSEVNDRTFRALGHPIESDDVAFAGAIGGGLDYALADNLQVGLAGKYIFTSTATTTADATRVNSHLDTALLPFALRILYPALQPEQEPGSGAHGAYAVYFGVRAGGATPVHRHVFGQVVANEENAALGQAFDQLYGAAFGLNLGPHLGVEMPFGGYEMSLELPGHGTIGEYAVYDLIPRVRARYPLLGGRLESYAMGGVGPTYCEFNDRRPTTHDLGGIHSDGFGFGGIFGAGLEYFVMKNVSIGGEVSYLMDRSHDLRIEDTHHAGNLDSLFLNLTVKVMLFESAEKVPSWLMM